MQENDPIQKLLESTHTIAVIGLSPSLATADHERAGQLVRQIGIRCLEVKTHEIDDPAYRANVGDRCYHCKSELFDRLEAIRVAEGLEVIFDGTNTDDFGDTRPGLTAAREHGVKSPLAEAGLDKAREMPAGNEPEFEARQRAFRRARVQTRMLR